jgi:hypothetical protein
VTLSPKSPLDPAKPTAPAARRASTIPKLRAGKNEGDEHAFEFRFLCRVISGDPTRDRIEDLLRQNIDWEALAHLAECHGVRPQLLHGLRRMDWANPLPETKHLLEEFQRLHPVQCLHLGAELLGIADTFAEKRVRFATFKGMALAISLYGDTCRREYSDIDLIVHEADLETAESCLRSRGYRAKSGDRSYRNAFLAYQNQYIFQTDEVMIDLHWDFSTKGVPFPLQAREIWDNLETVSIAGRDIPTLGRHELAILLAGHGTRHRWISLGWVCDFADFIRAYPEIDWTGLWRRAAQKNCGRPILLGCTLASRLLDAPVDAELLACADRGSAVQALADAAMKRMMDPPSATASTPEDFLGGLDLCETWIQKVRVLWGLATTRTAGDYEAMPLPTPLWGLYHLTRPLRLGIKVLSSARTRS